MDDEAQVRTICRMRLEAKGFDCLEAADGMLALQVLEEQPYDMVLMDVDMPNIEDRRPWRTCRSSRPARI